MEIGVFNTYAATPCPRGTFGSPDCQGICHCLSGNDYCQWEDGRCSDGRCSFGWINPPICQTGRYSRYDIHGRHAMDVCGCVCVCEANKNVAYFKLLNEALAGVP